jgi:hypothetical protein
MVFIKISEIIKQKSFFEIFVIVFISIIMTGTAFSASFLFQNVLLDSLRRFNIYDEKGKIVKCSIKSLIFTHFLSILVISLFITVFYQILKKW